MSNIISKSLVLGEVTLERLAAIAVPAQLAPVAASVATTYAEFKAAAAKADDATNAHASALDVVHTAASGVAASVDALAGAVVRVDPAKRLHPFEAFGVAAPATLLKGARGAAALRVADLAKKVAASKSRKGIKDAGVACAKAARALTKAHAKLTAPKVAAQEARQSRDTALADFTLTYETARQVGKRIWKSTPVQFDAVFGPIESFRYSPKRRHPAPAAETSGTEAAPTVTPSTTVAAAAAPVTSPPSVTNGAALNGAVAHAATPQ